MGRFMVVAIAAALVLGACTNDPPADGFEGLSDPSESPTPAPSPTASAEAAGEIDVTTTPDEITPEWVTAVVNTLLAEYGEMTAEILAMPVSDDPTLPDGFEERLDELFDGERLRVATTELQALLVDLDGRRATLLPPGEFTGLQFTTEVVQYARPDCVIAVGHVDRTGSAVSPPQSGLSAASLTPAQDGPTALQLVDLMPNTGAEGQPLPDETMLEADLDRYGDALSHTCGGAS